MQYLFNLKALHYITEHLLVDYHYNLSTFESGAQTGQLLYHNLERSTSKGLRKYQFLDKTGILMQEVNSSLFFFSIRMCSIRILKLKIVKYWDDMLWESTRG